MEKDLSFKRMFEMQDKLYEKNSWWQERSPQTSKDKLLWMFEEMGEIVAIIKKKGSDEIMSNPEVREDFLSECTDVLMYFSDVLKGYSVTEEELADAYIKKFEKNLNRDFSKHNKDKKTN